MKTVSVIIPLYNEQDSLNELYSQIQKSVSVYDYEIIFIDDGSTDKSWEILKKISNENFRVQLIKFYNNFGKSDALQEGFKLAKNEYVITMDGDLQDDPKEIPNLIKKIDEGWDVVSGWKKNRKDPINKTLPSKIFNAVTSFFIGLRLHDYNCGLKCYKIKVIKSIKIYGGLHRYLPAICSQKGYKISEIEVNHRKRKFGKTKYGNKRFFDGFFDLITVLFLGKYTNQPLHFFGFIGLSSSLAGVLIETYVLYLKYFRGEPFQLHFALLILGVLFIIVGIQFFSIGLIGEMIVGSISNNDKKRIDLIVKNDFKK